MKQIFPYLYSLWPYVILFNFFSRTGQGYIQQIRNPNDSFLNDPDEKVMYDAPKKEFIVKMDLEEYKGYSAKATKDHLNRLKFDNQSEKFIIRMSIDEYGKYDKSQRLFCLMYMFKLLEI